MARRKIDLLRDDVIAAARRWDECLTDADHECVDEDLHLAVDALNDYLRPIVDTPGEYVEGSPETARNAAFEAQPFTGKLRREIVDTVYSVQFFDSKGLTCEEIEHRLHGTHQTVSSAVNALMNLGWLVDSGFRRRNKSKRPAVVWHLTPAALAEMRSRQ